MHVHIYICTYIYVCIYMFVCMYVCAYVCFWICTFVRRGHTIADCTGGRSAGTHTYIYILFQSIMFESMYVYYIYMYTYIYIYMMNMYIIHIHMRMHTHIHTHIHIHIQTHTHICTCTYTSYTYTNTHTYMYMYIYIIRTQLACRSRPCLYILGCQRWWDLQVTMWRRRVWKKQHVASEKEKEKDDNVFAVRPRKSP